MPILLISDFLEQTHLSRDTVRGYLRMKVLHPRINPHSGYHEFTPEDVQRAIRARKLSKAGVPLRSIQKLLDHPETTEKRAQLLEVLTVIDQREAEFAEGRREVEQWIQELLEQLTHHS